MDEYEQLLAQIEAARQSRTQATGMERLYGAAPGAFAGLQDSGNPGQVAAGPSVSQSDIAMPFGRPSGGGVMETLADNFIGLDNGKRSLGEGLATLLNIGGESMTGTLVGDEADAAVRSLPALFSGGADAYGAAYGSNLEDYRGKEASMREDHPVLSFAADVGGALVPGMGYASAVGKGGNLFSRVLGGGILGTLAGGTAGFMEGEGGFGNRVRNMLPRGVVNPLDWGPAAVGGLIGAAVPGLGPAASAVYRRVGGGEAGALRAAESQLGISGAGTEMAADAISRDLPYSAPALERAGPNAVNAEMGPNATALLDYVTNQPGSRSTARSQIDSLAEGRSRDFGAAMDRALGAPEGAATTQGNIMRETAAARRDAYGAAYSAPIDYASDAGTRLQDLLQQVDPGAIRRAERIMRMEGAKSRQILAREQPDGSFVFERLPDVEQIDYITRALNDIAYNSGAGPAEIKAAGNLAREMRDTLDSLVPEYGLARAQGRDPILNRQAVEFGTTLLSPSVKMDVAEQTIEAMGPAERKFAAQGVRSQIDEVMANVKAAQTDGNMDIREVIRPLQEMMSRAGQRKLVALLGEEQAGRLLVQAKSAYSAISLRANTSVRSPTAPRLGWKEIEDARNPAGPMETLQAAGPGAAVGSVINRYAGNPAAARLAQNEVMREAVAQMLMSQVTPSSSGGVPALQQLPGLLDAVARTGGRIARTTDTLGGILGALAAQGAAR